MCLQQVSQASSHGPSFLEEVGESANLQWAKPTFVGPPLWMLPKPSHIAKEINGNVPHKDMDTRNRDSLGNHYCYNLA